MKKILIYIMVVFAVIVSGVELSTKALFESCGISVVAKENTESISMRFREKNSDKWNDALNLVKLPKEIRKATYGNFFGKDIVKLPVDKNEWRGSIVFLKENTTYELEITVNPEKKIINHTFTTMNSKVPIAETVYLDELPKGKTIIIDKKGKADGYIRYTMKDPNSIIEAKKSANQAILIRDSKYLLFEGITLKGGVRNGIFVRNSDNIRIVNCDISGFAPIWKQALDGDGKYLALDGKLMWSTAGIFLNNTSNILVERCYIHSPAGTANSWFFSHSCGPMAIATGNSKGGLVFRYNDFIGSDYHRWDDVIGGGENGSPIGGFNRDADVYGNMFALGNDDGIEFDGGASNVRCYFNRFESTLVGISIAPCIVGPSYVFRNLITNLGDFDNHHGSGLKTVFGDIGVGRIHYFNNTSPAISLPIQASTIELNSRLVTRNNIIFNNWILGPLKLVVDMNYDLFYNPNKIKLEQTKAALTKANQEKNAIWKKPLFIENSFRLKENSPGVNAGIHIANFQEQTKSNVGAFINNNSYDLPYRPIGFSLSSNQINFAYPNKVEEQKIEVIADKNFKSNFKVRKNADVNWFTVSPMEGEISNNKDIKFSVKLNYDKMTRAKRYKDAFIVRMPNGFSRAVMVYADMRNSQELKNKEKGFFLEVDAIKLKNASEYKKNKENTFLELDLQGDRKPLIWNFEIPEDGNYYLFANFKTSGIELNLFEFSVNNDNKKKVSRQLVKGSYTEFMWQHMYRKGVIGNRYFEFFYLKKGKHELKIFPRREMNIKKIAITNDIEMIYR